MRKFDIYELWFIALPISGEKKIEIIKNIGNYHEIYENRSVLFKNIFKNKKKILEISLNNDKIRKIEEGLEKQLFGIVTYMDEYYPMNLKVIPQKPFALFYKGNIERINEIDSIAIVGSRNATEYGYSVTKDIVSNLANQNVAIISGGALGIDSMAHRTAINNEVFNIVVLGCGIDVIYPRKNLELFKDLLKNGVVLTEYLPGDSPKPYHFPYRNRIISGISKGVIIIEAAIKSGAVITTSYAAEQGKRVIAVPGNIYSNLSLGCNKLIADGASIYDGIEDVFFQFNINYMKNKVRKEKCNGLKEKILKLLEENLKHIEEIKRQTNIDISMINELLFEMQFNNEIIGLTGNYFAKNIINT